MAKNEGQLLDSELARQAGRMGRTGCMTLFIDFPFDHSNGHRRETFRNVVTELRSFSAVRFSPSKHQDTIRDQREEEDPRFARSVSTTRVPFNIAQREKKKKKINV